MTVNTLPHCFYAIVTANNQANLVAVFAMAQPGDHIVWLQTPTAVQKRWLKNADAVLDPRRLTSQTVNLSEEDELSPFHLSECIRSLGREKANTQPVFILNGGQKFTALGFERASHELEPAPLVLYADVFAAKLLRLDASTASFHPISWGPYSLTFDELLRLRGNTYSQRKPGRRIWPDPPVISDPLATVRTNPILQSLVLRIFSTCTKQYVDNANETAGNDDMRRNIEKLPVFVSNPLNTEPWSAIIRTHICNKRLRGQLRNHEYINTFHQGLSNVQGAFFKETAGFFRNQALACLSGTGTVAVNPDEEAMLRGDGWINGTLSGGLVQNENVAKSFGMTFEEAVAARLLAFLRDNPEHAASVREVWTGVEVCRDDGTPFQEYDVAILFDSGRLVHLECKAGTTVPQNVLYSRLGALQRTGGEGAMQVICGPLFGTSDDEREEFVKLHQIQAKVKHFGLTFLPYDKADGFEEGLHKIFDVHYKARKDVASVSDDKSIIE